MTKVELNDESIKILEQRMLTYSLSSYDDAIKSINRELVELEEMFE